MALNLQFVEYCCISAKAAGNHCESGAIGAVVGEMWGDYQVDDPNTLRPDELLRNANTKIGSPTCGSLSGCIGFNISFNKTNYNPKNIYK